MSLQSEIQVMSICVSVPDAASQAAKAIMVLVVRIQVFSIMHR